MKPSRTWLPESRMLPSADNTRAAPASPSRWPSEADGQDELEGLMSPTFRLPGIAEHDGAGAGFSTSARGCEQRPRAPTRRKARRMSDRHRYDVPHINTQFPPLAQAAAPAAKDGRAPDATDAKTDSILPTSAFPPPTPDEYAPGQKKSLEGIAVRAFCLGAVQSASALGVVLILALTSSPLWRVPFFLAALATFHFLEFWTTARANLKEANVKAFLLTANWPAYAIAHASATVECLVTNLLWPNRAWAPLHTGPVLLPLGLVFTLVGQFIRTTAMVQAGPSFNHIVQTRQRSDHVLVTTGMYGIIRHPAYFGFFWWGVGTQLVLGNPLCFLVYAAVLWRFFQTRIKDEEGFLISFYKDDYIEYKKRVPTRIPFIP